MKRPGKKYIALFVLVLLATLLVTAPATLMASLAGKLSQGKFVLANASGTIWKGSATPALRQHSGGLLVLDKLNWDIAAWQLFTGKLAVQLRWENIAQPLPMQVTASFMQVELKNAVLPLYANLLGEAIPLLKPIQLSGQVNINSPQFVLTRQGLNGQATAEWLNAGSVLSAVKPLGHYRIDLNGSGTRLEIALKTLSGELQLDGSGAVVINQGVTFNGTARAASDKQGGLKELLANFGPETAPGVHAFSVVQ